VLTSKDIATLALQLHCCAAVALLRNNKLRFAVLTLLRNNKQSKAFIIEKKVSQDAVLPQQYNCSGAV